MYVSSFASLLIDALKIICITSQDYLSWFISSCCHHLLETKLMCDVEIIIKNRIIVQKISLPDTHLQVNKDYSTVIMITLCQTC